MGILIGFDDTPHGRDALALALQIAAKDGEPLTVATAFPDDERGLLVAVQDSAWVARVRAVAERKLESARRLVGDRPQVTYRAIGPSSASRGLHELAEQMEPRLLVVGSSEHAAIGRISPGSTVENLLHGAPCPVAVAPRGYRDQQREIQSLAVAYDATPAADQALAFAVEAARRRDASLRLVMIAHRSSDGLQAKLDDAAGQVAPEVKTSTEVIVGQDIVETLADLPGEQPDALICGSRGYGVARQVLLGSVSNRLIRNAAYPVVVVPRQV
jgi:nucleotide-binding universal stress UspA family protein